MRGAVPESMANDALDRILEISPTSPKILAAMNGPTPGDLREGGIGLIEFVGETPVGLGDLCLQPQDLAKAPPQELCLHGAIPADEGAGLDHVPLRSQVRHHLLVAGADDHQVGVDAVGHLGSGPNQLVTVVDEQLQVGEQRRASGRGQGLIGRHHTGDGHRVNRVGLALGASASLEMGERRGDLPNILPVGEQRSCGGRSVAERSLDPDRARLPQLRYPPKERPVAGGVVGELADAKHPAEGVDRCRGEAPLVGIDPDRHLHAGLPSPADLRWWPAEDKQASG